MLDLNLDSLLVVDIEATCWLGHPPPGEQNEIIEIGVCLLSFKTGAISGKRSILIKPTRSRVSPFCTELTTLTQDDVDAGMTFAQACDLLRTEYDAAARVWSSWGSYDKRMIAEQCAAFGVDYPFSFVHVNLKKVFRKVYRVKQAPALALALEAATLPIIGTPHRGADDAYNTAALAAEMLKLGGREVFGVKA